MNYRPDIDGLRAIAVLSVVFFHLDISIFKGGYIGVDIFYVISGYLISNIIKRNHAGEGFILSGFYIRRIRRLMPALIATIIGTFIAACFILTPIDMISFAESVTAACFSLSNFLFYQESGYWDTESTLKPLLHTWSLGVEEQFYLLWPTFLIFLIRISKTIPLSYSLGVITFIGAAFCIYYTNIDQAAAFYLLPFRVFQFSIGALIIPTADRLRSLPSLNHQRLREITLYGGLVLISFGILTINENTVFPGWAILYPTLGATLILLSGTFKSEPPLFGKYLLESQISNWIGKVSYSMYLVHWPLYSLYRYHTDREFTNLDKVVLFAGTILLTVFLHYFVERRFYKRHTFHEHKSPAKVSNGRFALLALLIIFPLSALASSAWLGNGWQWRFPTIPLSAEDIIIGKKNRYARIHQVCPVTGWPADRRCKDKTSTQVLVIGNSHAPDGLNFLFGAYENKRINIIYFGSTNQCKDLHKRGDRFFSSNPECQHRLDSLFNFKMIKNLDVILYAANQPYSGNKGTFFEIIKTLKDRNPKLNLVTFGGYINTKRECSYYINLTGSSESCVLPSNVTYFADKPEQQKLFIEFRRLEAKYIDRVSLLCSRKTPDSCMNRTINGVPMSYDQHHQSREFAEMSGKLYRRLHPKFLSDDPSK